MKSIWVISLALAAAMACGQTGTFQPYRVSLDFREVVNRKQFTGVVTLTPEHRQLLQKNLFVASPRGDAQLFWVYGTNDYRNLPSLITADNVLHLYHVYFDSTLRALEQKYLLPKLKRLTTAVAAESVRQYEQATDPLVKAAALKNIAYFLVASNLAGQISPKAPSEAVELAKRELEAVKGAQGFRKSAIFPYEIDYSRFIPRGHYTKSDELKSYFRAMTWFGLVPFALTERDGTTPNQTNIRMAALASQALHDAKATGDWEAIYEPTSLYVGASNMFTPEEIRAAAFTAFGSAKAFRADRYDEFVSQMKALRVPKIVANRRGNMPGAQLQFRFMGLRYIPDSEILQRLTGEFRGMPAGLDVMAVLGSKRATEILDASPRRYNPTGWSGYQPERAKLTAEFAQVPEKTWASNLYWGWIDSIRLLLKRAPAGSPSFMMSSAWQDKCLSTALAWWAELRHDTILYGEQSVAEMGGDDTEPPFVRGFVEPNVPLYTRLIALVRQSRDELKKRSIIDKQVVEKFNDFEGVLNFLLSVSRKEMAGTRLTRKEHERIRHLEGELGDLLETMLLYGNNFKALTMADKDMALVADVHTGGASALQVAVGRSDDLIAVVPIEGKLYFARGSIFSYYEFEQPLAKRLTDERWREMLDKEQAPPRPHWVSSFFTSKKAEDK